jgi:hypothetical protein
MKGMGLFNAQKDDQASYLVRSEMQNDHVSVDEAVARLMNLDFVPAPFTVLELLEGFLLQAQEQYERIPAGTDNQIERNSYRAAMKVCESRLDLGKVLVEAIESEIKRGNLITKITVSSVQQLSWASVKIWAEDMFGLSVVERTAVLKKRSVDLGTSQLDKDEQMNPLDKTLATWGPRKAKNFLVTFYALALDVAYRHPKTMLTAARTVEKTPLAIEIEGLVERYAKPCSIDGQGHESILDRLEPARVAWEQAMQVKKK